MPHMEQFMQKETPDVEKHFSSRCKYDYDLYIFLYIYTIYLTVKIEPGGT